jgi:hypothetical protein
MSGLRTELGQLNILSRHFFGRMFRNETVDFEDQMKERLIVALTLLAVFFAWSSQLLMFKYHFVPDANRSWQEKNYIFTLMMLVFAVVTLLEWDVLFPDRQDFSNLMPLPVRLRTMFAAKLVSFVLFIGMFSVAMTSVSSVLFAYYLAEWRAHRAVLVVVVRYILSHILAGFAANFAVFFSFVFLQSFLMAVIPPGLYRQVSLLVRFVLITALVFLLFGFVAQPSMLGGSFRSLETLKDTGDPFLLRYPPLWFVGLYEVFVGTGDPLFEAQACTGGLVLLLSLAAFAASSALSYHRHVRRTLEVRKGRPPLFRFREVWRSFLSRTVLRAPEERAVFGFFSETLRTSGKHRMSLAYYLAVGSAMILILAVSYRESFRALTPANGFFLVQPLLLVFALVAGIRVLVDRPAAPEANWVFRLTETPRIAKYLTGLKKSVLIGLILPLFGLVFALHAWLWDARTAFLHAGFGLVISVLAVEAAFYRYRKVPFACTYVPGKLKLQFTAIPVLIGLPLAMMALAAIEKTILRDPGRGIAFLAVAAAALFAMRFGNRTFYRTKPLLFEEHPDAAMVTFPES